MLPINLLCKEVMNEAALNRRSHIIIAIDIHDTILDSKVFYDSLADGATIEQSILNSMHTESIAFLQICSIRNDIKLVLFNPIKLNTHILIKDLFDNLFDIKFDYLNSSEFAPDNPKEIQDFDAKLYYDLLIDARTGFEPKDFLPLYKTIRDNYIIPIKNGDS